MLGKVYGDSAAGCEAQGNAQGWITPWIDLDRIDAEIVALVDRDAAQAERFFLNRKRASESRAFSLDRWDELAVLEHEFSGDGRSKMLLVAGYSAPVRRRSKVVAAVDGARFADALAIVATEVSTGYQWKVGIWSRPENAADDYEHDFEEVDGAMTDLFDGGAFDVQRVLVDPQYIEPLLDRWQGRWGDKRVLPWLTSRPRQMAEAVRRYTEAIAAGDLSHDGDEEFRAHIANATRRKANVYDDEHRQLYVIAKDRPGSPRKMDAAVAAVLSWEAKRDVESSGAGTRSKMLIA